MQRSHLKERLTAKELLAPQSPVAGTVNGTAIDAIASGALVPQNDALAVLSVGATSSNPTVVTLAATLQESSDNTTFTTAKDNRGVDVTLTVTGTAAAVAGIWPLPGYSPNALKRYRRLSITTSYTGGTAPTTFFSASEVAGGARSI